MAPDENFVAPPPDLRLLFATNATDLEARKVFVNRIPEQQAFDRAVAAHRQSTLSPDFDSEDVLAPRRNVLVYYGVGGVGKTTLSRELERRHVARDASAVTDWPVWHKDFERSVTARIDLASEAALDLERVLVSLRVAVAALGRPMHAFDIALGRYWEHVHPNESLAEYVRSDTRLARISESLRVPEQITEGLQDVASALGGPAAVVSLATNLAVTITGSVRRRMAMKHAVQGCRRLSALLASEPDMESLSYYPHLLAWDLAQAARRSGNDFHAAVFFDTFEDVTGADQRRFERLINRLVWLLPNVLFVVSTRNRLDWGDSSAEGQLDFAGPARWPGLVMGSAGEPSQHLVGYLSAEDSDKFLRQRLRRGDDAAIPEAVRTRITRDSEGYPLYLDLAITHYLQLIESGAEPDPDDFSGGFPALVTRVLRDLPPDERRLIRILSLLDSFDARLAAQIAQLPSEAAALALTQRAFVDVDDAAPFPCSIHRLLREQIRASDSGPDAFGPADWSRYAGRAFDELGARFAQAPAAGDRPLVISLLNQALRLGDEFDLPVGWTADAAYSYIQDNLWENSLRPLVRLPPATAAAALAQTLLAITNRQVEGRRQAAATLAGLLESGLLAGDTRDLAAYYAAESFREIGEGERSERLLQSLIARDSRIADLACKGMVHRLRRQGRFADALNLIRSRPQSSMWMQMTGTLYWSQGMLDEAKQAYETSRDRSLAEGLPGQAAEISGCLAFVSGLCAVHDADAGLVAAGEIALQQSRNTWARLMADLGGALLTATGDAATAERLARIEAAGQAAGLTSIQAYARFAACLNAALSGEDAALRTARAALTDLSAADFRWLVQVVDFWQGAADPAGGDGDAVLDWLGGADAACARWLRVVAARRVRLADPDGAPPDAAASAGGATPAE
jgi:predicted negative regulator of RcsB-dependent stress response